MSRGSAARRAAEPGSRAGGAAAARIRLDRWLCHARVFKTRSLAADRIAGGGIRMNGAPCRKPAQIVGAGDVITIALGAGRVRTLRVVAAGLRRGPPDEAQQLYDDLSPEGVTVSATVVAEGDAGG